MFFLQFISGLTIIIVQIIMTIWIKYSDTLKFNGTHLDYGSELCFVLFFQIATVSIGFSIYILDEYCNSWNNFWLENDIKYFIFDAIVELSLYNLPMLG